MGIETADDAAVYKLSDNLAMINTVDFITPPVDDPYWFGQIAAANSISDVYSMGGKPNTALNLVMFPQNQLDLGVLRDILNGAADKVAEAKACLVGGHSVDDEEPKFGLCVNGIVHPDRVITNAGSLPGDALILTKPLGTGVIFNAVRAKKIPYKEVEKEVLPIVASLNDRAMEVALKYDVNACTDITGFGIAGHLAEVAQGSKVSIKVEYNHLAFYPGAFEMYRKGVSTGSNKGNREMVKGLLSIMTSLTKAEEELLFDPQTSGGLLISLPYSEKDNYLEELNKKGVPAYYIGRVEKGSPEVHIV